MSVLTVCIWSHLTDVPVDIPLSHGVVSPCFNHISYTEVDTYEAIVGNSEDLILTTAFKSVCQM